GVLPGEVSGRMCALPKPKAFNHRGAQRKRRFSLCSPVLPVVESFSTTSLISKQDSQIAHVVARRPSHNGVSESVEQRECVEGLQCRPRVQTSLGCPFDSRAIHHGSCGGTIAIEAVSARTKNGNVFASNLPRTLERELLIAAARASVCHLDGDLST